MKTYTVWRSCAHCGAQFGQPNDPGRKRRYCTDACKQAAYRLRKRAGQHTSREHARRAREEEARRRRYEEHQRQERAREEARRRQRQHTYQPPPRSNNGYSTDTAEQARIRRIIEGLLRKAASTKFPHEAAACRAKVEELRRKHGL